MIFVRGVIAFALMLCLLPGSILADDTVSRKLLSKGYDPSKMEQDGQAICQASSSDLALLRTRNQEDALSASLKRERLIYAAIGFAKLFAAQRNQQLVASALSGRGPGLGCGAVWGDDCIGVAPLIRELSKIGPTDDWCSAFVATLTKMVDEQSKGGPKNLLHQRGGSDASDYASAAKLLAIFDPKVPITSIAWTGTPPKKNSNAFIPANMEPIPGCLAIYKDLDSPPNKIEGHMTLVISVTNGPRKEDRKVSTVEGNTSPVPGSGERGVFAKFEQRPWGEDQQFISSTNKHHMAYQGCVMPWPGDSVVADHSVCDRGTADNRLKPVEIPALSTGGGYLRFTYPIFEDSGQGK